MAATTLDLNNEILNAAYKRTYESSAPQRVTYNPIKVADDSLESITSRVRAALNPMYDSAVQDRLQGSVEARAQYDADAYSRGMGASTWLSDVKGREGRAAASDIAKINASLTGTVAENATSQWQNYLGNKLAADTANSQGQLNADLQNAQNVKEYEQWVYSVLADMVNSGVLNLNPGGSSPAPGAPGGPAPVDEEPIVKVPVVMSDEQVKAAAINNQLTALRSKTGTVAGGGSTGNLYSNK